MTLHGNSFIIYYRIGKGDKVNKKAFTLIELIAVIVILSLIALIVFPAVNSVIKNSKEKAYQEQIKTIIKSAKQLSYENSEVLPDEGETSEIQLTCLTSGCTYNGVQIKGGYINEDDIIDPRNTKKKLDGLIIITYTSNQYNYTYEEQAQIATTTGDWLLQNASDSAVLKANQNTYRGTSDDNYINFSGSTWKILQINSDDTITIIKNTPVTTLAFDSNNSTNFENSSINSYLNNTYYNSLSQKNYIKKTQKCIGPYNNPCEETYTANVGLLTTEEYINTSNDTNCNIDNLAPCANGNFLVTTYSEYTMNYNESGVIAINNGTFVSVDPTTALNIRPVVTLTNDTKITGGSGSADNPYLIG